MKFISIIFLFLSQSTFAGDLFFSATGNNANDGLSEGAPKQTIAHLNAIFSGLSAGTNIRFKRGDVFYGQIILAKSGAAGNHITFSDYGLTFLAKPLILGGKTENLTSDWTNISGNLWENSDAVFSVDCANLVFNNEASCGTKLMNSDSSLISTQGQFWYSFTRDVVRIYSVGNPASFYSNIQVVLRENAIKTNSYSYMTFTNLDFRYWGLCVWEQGGNYYNWLNCDISYIGGADQLSNYTTRYGNGLQLWEGTHDVNITGCRISNVYDAGISPQGYSAGYTAYRQFIRNNIIQKCEYSFEFFLRDAGSSCDSIFFEYNTCVDAGGGWGHNQRPDGANGTHMRNILFTATRTNIFIRNNIFKGATERLVWWGSSSDLTGITISNNLYLQAGSEPIARMSTTNYSTLGAWQSASSKDASSINSDPLLNVDFTLPITSPALTAGVAGTFIGAYDFQCTKAPRRFKK